MVDGFSMRQPILVFTNCDYIFTQIFFCSAPLSRMSDVFVKAVLVTDNSHEAQNVYHCPVYRNRVSYFSFYSYLPNSFLLFGIYFSIIFVWEGEVSPSCFVYFVKWLFIWLKDQRNNLWVRMGSRCKNLTQMWSTFFAQSANLMIQSSRCATISSQSGIILG